MLTVRINVHPHELDNALTRLHRWSHQYDWEHNRPDITVELNVVPDYNGNAEKFDGDRFADPEAKPITAEPEQSANEILSMIRNRHAKQPLSPQTDLEAESLELMNFLRGGNNNG